MSWEELVRTAASAPPAMCWTQPCVSRSARQTISVSTLGSASKDFAAARLVILPMVAPSTTAATIQIPAQGWVGASRIPAVATLEC